MATTSSNGASDSAASDNGSLLEVGVEEPVKAEALVLGDQQLRVLVLRVVQDLAGGAVLDHRAVPHYQHLVAELGDDREVMGDQHEREPLGFAQFLEQVQDLC